MLYLIPKATHENDELEQLAQKAGVPVIEVEFLYQLIKRSDESMIIARISPHLALTLMRDLGTLLAEVPSVVLHAPGSAYSIDWNSALAPLPVLDWKELEGKISKSGLLSQTTEQAQDRSPAADTATQRDNRARGTFVRQPFNDSEKEEEDLMLEVDSSEA